MEIRDVIKQGIIALIVFIATIYWRDSVWEDKITNAPVQRDTVQVLQHDTITVVAQARLAPDPRIDTVIAETVTYADKDSLLRDLAQIATLDTTVHDTRIEVKYQPLVHQFDLRVTPPPKHNITITNTKTVIVTDAWWEDLIFAGACVATGVGVANDDWVLAGAGAGVAIGVKIGL